MARKGNPANAALRLPYVVPYTAGAMRKTSVYLDERGARRLARLAREEGRPQAEIIRDAISSYEPPSKRDRDFELSKVQAPRIDGDPRPIWEIPDEELMRGFGEDSFGG